MRDRVVEQLKAALEEAESGAEREAGAFIPPLLSSTSAIFVTDTQ